MSAPLSRARVPRGFDVARRRLTPEEAAERAAAVAESQRVIDAAREADRASRPARRTPERRALDAHHTKVFHDAVAAGMGLAAAKAVADFVWHHFRDLAKARRAAEREKARAERKAERSDELRAMNRERVARWRAKQKGGA